MLLIATDRTCTPGVVYLGHGVRSRARWIFVPWTIHQRLRNPGTHVVVSWSWPDDFHTAREFQASADSSFSVNLRSISLTVVYYHYSVEKVCLSVISSCGIQGTDMFLLVSLGSTDHSCTYMGGGGGIGGPGGPLRGNMYSQAQKWKWFWYP